MNRTQSLAGYIREHLSELEERLSFGVRQEVFVSELEARGYKTTLKGFRNFLYRARLGAAQKQVRPPPIPETPTDAPFVTAASSRLPPRPPNNPLTKSKGFEFVGTSAIDESELI
ncbi:hypothetical protein GHT07_18915 [Caenimonas koreensis DSM 17982]|uniref:Uncharacterized protein n=1 Tax=Caenimonas koreensis DSM 17982 TaxID=1121255 RepID=A0A844B871_9BURK|nr:hypothetical protein [Caenimonas koreensis]MRD49352.1 hypothetical protein [Caenimonas koreensis DSM 17982]